MMPLEGSGMQQVCWAHRGGSSSCFRAMISMASQASDVVKGIQAGEEVVSMGTKRRNSMEWAMS